MDLTKGAIVGHTEQVGAAPAGRGLDIRAGGSRLALLPSGSWAFSAASPAYGISLTLRPEKPYVLHGGGSGVIAQSTGGSSSYYSDTRLAATGSLRAGAKTVRLSGEGWFDHQWGSFATDPAAFDWDWFACRLDDGRDLMLYQFRDRKTGKPLARYRSGTLVARDGSSAGGHGVHGDTRSARLHRRGPRLAARLDALGAVGRARAAPALGDARPARPGQGAADLLGGSRERDRVGERLLLRRAELPLAGPRRRPGRGGGERRGTRTTLRAGTGRRAAGAVRRSWQAPARTRRSPRPTPRSPASRPTPARSRPRSARRPPRPPRSRSRSRRSGS